MPVPGVTPSLTLIVALLFSLPGCGIESESERSSEAAAKPPDILFIAIDDLNDWVGPLGGHSQVSTPNIDRLAARGMTFTNAHSNAASCNPSRWSLMSGLRPSTSGLYTNYPHWTLVPAYEDATMLPEHLRANGYLSRGAGKIYHAHNYAKAGQTGNNHAPSWDEYFPSADRQLIDDGHDTAQPANNSNPGGRTFMGFDWRPLEEGEPPLSDTQTTDWIVKTIAAGSDRPTFTAAGIYRPHLPWYTPAKYFDLYPLAEIQLPEVLADDLADVPEAAQSMNPRARDLHAWVAGNDRWPEAVQAYLASISYADHQVGKILDAVDQTHAGDSTIIVLFSDHGFHLGQKQHWRKMALWRQTTRIPLIIVAPGVTTPGTTSDMPVSLLDVYPTVVALSGVDLPPQTLEGESLMPLLQDAEAPWDNVAVSTWGSSESFGSGRAISIHSLQRW